MSRSNRHEVTVVLELERPATISLAAVGMGSWTAEGETLTEHELRAAVSLVPGTRDELEVQWLDKAVLEDLDLDDSELEGAEEQARELWWQWAMGRDSEDDERADYERDHAEGR